MQSLALVLNARAGRARSYSRKRLRAAVEAAAEWADVTVFDGGRDVTGAAREACASGADAVAIAGGDGTAAAVLDEARRCGCTSLMVPLPMGTANMLPRRLYGQRSFETILTELPTYRALQLHAGEAAGRSFFVALMAGAPVRFGQAREALRPDSRGRRLGEAVRRLRQGLASLTASRLRLTLEGAEQKVARFGAVIVAPGGFASLHGAEEPPGSAVLEHLVVRPSDPADLALKTASFLTGLPDPAEAAVASTQPSVLSGPKRIHLMLDGEVFKADAPVEIRLIENAVAFAAPAREAP